jgi:XTP/dITP diphosphohydrolase
VLEGAPTGHPERSFPARIAIASRNRHKIDEILAICEDWPVAWVTAGAEWPDVEETGSSYLDNALLKARAVANATGMAALADDSGIEVDALGGGPGPRSARFAGEEATDRENLDLLLDRVRRADPAGRSARYRCVAALAWPSGEELWTEGVCEGRIILEPRGSGGFGYDPAFVPQEEDERGTARTMAELPAHEKHAISHRGRAFRALRSLLAAVPPDPTV